MIKKKVPVKKSPYPSVTVFSEKTKKTKLKFPNIPRSITERFSHISFRKTIGTPAFFFHILSVGIFVAILYQGNTLFTTWQTFSLIQKEEAQIYQEVTYWQDITRKFSNYRDGYFSLAVLYYRLGNDMKAKENLDKVLSIDPRFEQGIAFAKIIK
jgi:tetratricopeptide (TPR) repeat protein